MRGEWAYRALGDIAQIKSGFTPSTNELYPEGTIPYFKVGDMNSEGNLKYLQNTSAYLLHSPITFPKGAIVFPKNGAAVATNKKRILRQKSVVDLNTAVLISSTDYCSEYLYYWLNSIDFRAITRGGAIPTLDLKGLRHMLVPAIDLSEQERVVSELDLLQGIINKQKAQLKELDTLAQSIFCELNNTCEGKQTHLGDVCTVVSGLVDPNEEPYCNYPHIGGANIESGTGRFIDVKLAKDENLISGKYPFDESMILYSKIRPNLNKVALPIFVGICSADMYPLIPKANVVNRVYLKFILTQPGFLEYAISHSGRANIPKINRQDLLEYSFNCWPLDLQLSFATKIEAIEHQKSLINQSIAETQKLFDYTMDKYFG